MNLILGQKNHAFQFVLICSIGLTLLKIALLPWVQITDSDAVSRIFLSQSWASHPHIITNSVWGPFHFYLNGILFIFWNDSILAPSLLNIIISSLTLFPFYFFTRRLFNSSGAAIATLFLGTCPILFRNSFFCLSETPFLFFLALGLNFISKSIHEKKTIPAIVSGLAFTIAAGFRYEAWLLIFLFAGALFINSSFKTAILFCLSAALFPVYWLISNEIYTGDAMFSINGNYRWTIEKMGNNENIDFESHLRRLWYFPFSWIIAVGPFSGWLILKYMKTIWKNVNFKSIHFLISLITIFFLLIMIYNAFNGTLLLQHRFIGTVVLLSLPLVAYHFVVLDKKNLFKAIILCISTVSLSFVYNSSGVKPVPRLKNQQITNLVLSFQPYLTNSSALVIDFISWEETYYCALMSRLPQSSVFLVGGAKYSDLPLDAVLEQLRSNSSTILVLKNKSAFYMNLFPEIQKLSGLNKIKLDTLYDQDEIICIKCIKK
jgi:4-amino-4-deoxy-L-arabinose transferase-like glycosyltransferase